MKLIVCVDERNGMLFNKRRQSRDRLLIADIMNLAQGSNIWINRFSQNLFESEKVKVSEDEMSNLEKEDFCFIENIKPSSLEEKADEIIIYHWNRMYPADEFFDIDLEENWVFLSEYEFEGSSHEKITRRIYTKKK